MAKLERSSEQVNDFAHHIKQLSGFCGQPAHLVRVWPECHGPISVKSFLLVATLVKQGLFHFTYHNSFLIRSL